MKSGSMAAHEQARNIEDATDGWEGSVHDPSAKVRAKRNTTPLSAEQCVARVRAIFSGQKERIAALIRSDVEDAQKLVARVPTGPELETCLTLLRAINITLPVAGEAEPEQDDAPETDDTPSRPGLAGYDEVPRGATDYVPSPLAQAARARR